MGKVNEDGARGMPPGTLIDGRYKVVRFIGQGGNGLVHEVEHVLTGRRLALKSLLDETGYGRLEQEARAAALMRNPHAVKITDMGTTATAGPYIVMELLDGQSLRALLEETGQLPLELTANIALQVCECLTEAHAQGIIHRDLKPDNIYLCPGPYPGTYDVKVLDFGVVKISNDGPIPNSSLTRTGSTVGTPYYMSLEQLRNSSNVDARSDIYSLAVVLYESLCGSKPFQAETIGDLVYALCSGPPTHLGRLRPDLPPELCDVIMRALSVQREQRQASMAELATQLMPHGDASLGQWLKEPRSSASGTMPVTRAREDAAPAPSVPRGDPAPPVPRGDPAPPVVTAPVAAPEARQASAFSGGSPGKPGVLGAASSSAPRPTGAPVSAGPPRPARDGATEGSGSTRPPPPRPGASPPVKIPLAPAAMRMGGSSPAALAGSIPTGGTVPMGGSAVPHGLGPLRGVPRPGASEPPPTAELPAPGRAAVAGKIPQAPPSPRRTENDSGPGATGRPGTVTRADPPPRPDFGPEGVGGGDRDTPTEMYTKGVHGVELPGGGGPRRDTPTSHIDMSSVPMIAAPDGPTLRFEEAGASSPGSPALDLRGSAKTLMGSGPDAFGNRTSSPDLTSALDAVGPASVALPFAQTTPAGNDIPLALLLQGAEMRRAELAAPPPPGQSLASASFPAHVAAEGEKPGWQRILDRALYGVGGFLEQNGRKLGGGFRGATPRQQIAIVIAGASLIAILIVLGIYVMFG